MKVYRARWVIPVASPPIGNGAVAVVEGRIVAVGGFRELAATGAAGAEILDLGDSVLVPGLINAHTHLELSDLAGTPAATDYVGWIRGLLDGRARSEPARARLAAQREIVRLVERGTAAVGDVANEPWSVPLLARSELLGVSFLEIYGFRAADAQSHLDRALCLLETLAADSDVRAAGERWTVAATPHAPHTTSAPLLRALGARAAAARAPLSIHVAESEVERELLATGGGAFHDLLRERGQWDDDWEPPRRSPVAWLDRVGLLGPRTLAVHAVHLDREDRALLRSRAVTVVTCPRSNERLAVGRAPVTELLREGVPIALGTDSLASNDDLDCFAEMAALRRVHPGLAPADVLRIATAHGAQALGLADRLGSIERGKLARLAVVPLEAPADDPLETVTVGPAETHALELAPRIAAS